MHANSRQIVLNIGVVGIATLAGALIAALISYAPQIGAEPSRGSSSGALPGPSLIGDASPTAGPAAVLVGAGDIADCDRNEDTLTADLVEIIPGSVFTLGDNAYPNGNLTDFQNCYGPTWGRPSIKERTRPAAGENDYDTQGAAGYFAYFGDAAGDPATGYYAYDAGAWRVYVLNSDCRSIGGCGTGTPQDLWLIADLAKNPRQCVVAMWHHPLFSSGRKGGTSSTRNLWRVLEDAGAELVLSAHNHVYERFAPQTGAGVVDLKQGMVQIVVGTGGGAPDPFGSPAPNSVVRASHVFGVLRLELAPSSYAFEFITVAGPHFTDSGAGECH
jgi:Calcineurin-like phosphoesterase